MFLQFSPPSREVTKKKKPVKKEEEDTPVLVLAPFSPSVKLFFENVHVGDKKIKTLSLKNPHKRDIEINITNKFAAELNVELSWQCARIPPESQEILTLKWAPQEGGIWRHTMHFSDGQRLRFDVPVVFKAISSKKKAKATFNTSKRKSPVKNGKKSPVKKSKQSTANHLVLPNITNVQSAVKAPSFLLHERPRNDKENRLFVVPPEERRETYTVYTKPPPLLQTLHEENVLDDSLEETVSENHQFSTKVQTESFFLFTPENRLKPCASSTEEKSFDSEIFHGKKVSLFKDASPGNPFIVSSYAVNTSSATYTKDSSVGDVFHLSSPRNCVNTLPKIPHTQFEFSAQFNSTSATYVKDISLGMSSDISLCSNPRQYSTISTDENRPNPRQSLHHSVRHDSLLGTAAKDAIEWRDDKFTKPEPLLPPIKDRFSFSNLGSMPLKRRSEIPDLTPCKRANLECRSSLNDWSKHSIQPIRISRNSTAMSKEDGVMSRRDTFTVQARDPFVLAAVDKIDPFMSLVDLDEEWVKKQEDAFLKWLNVMLAPPAALETNAESVPMDIARVWKMCQEKSHNVKTETKETISSRLCVDAQLRSLRVKARNLYCSKEVQTVLQKVYHAVENEKVSVRGDRDIHLDLACQKEILSILFSYNPLWLRIGLETIYGTVVDMPRGNTDWLGLSTFISNNLFKSLSLIKRYKSTYSAKYRKDIKKEIVKKFLSLVYFLDLAKSKRLIPHDPCLFCKNAPIKESAQCLFTFARETLAAIGDVTKHLKFYDYVVQHKQTYLDEYNYAVTCLGVDLRDGVRLARLMQIVLLRNDLLSKMRVPAVSRLQKVHNVKISMDALAEANCQILYDICPKDIVDGHKEKTLSFLWQLVNKFHTPLMILSAEIIQKWWRSNKLSKKRAELRERHAIRSEAACKIQKWFRYKKRNIKLLLLAEYERKLAEEQKRESAAIKIQSIWRMYTIKRQYQRMKCAVIVVEERYLAKRVTSLQSEQYQKLRWAAITIQRRYRGLLATRKAVEEFSDLKHAAIVIQKRYRALQVMRAARNEFLTIRTSIITIQTWYRSILTMREEQLAYIAYRYAAMTIQRQFRAILIGRQVRSECEKLRLSTVTIQRRYRATMQMRQQLEDYNRYRKAVITIQRGYRALLATRKAVEEFTNLKHAAIVIQKRYRALQVMRVARNEFLTIKTSIITIQTWYRSILTMREVQSAYITYRYTVITVQRQFRAILLGRQVRSEFEKLKRVTVTVQRRYRATLQMRQQLEDYNHYRKAVVTIQTLYRAKLLGRQVQNEYQQLKQAAVTIQKRFRILQVTKQAVAEFQRSRDAIIAVQRRFRARKVMIVERTRFVTLKTAIIKIQKRWRQIHLEKKQRWNGAVKIQAALKGYLVRKRQKTVVLEIRKRLVQANENAVEANTLKNVFHRAVSVLDGNSPLSEITISLNTIDAITRTSQKICLQMSKKSIHMYLIIANCNRSPPEIETATIAARILINFVRYQHSRPFAFHPQHIDDLFVVMLHVCDKESLLFPTLCTVLYNLAHDPVQRRAITECPQFKQGIMAKIETACERRGKMVKKMNNAFVSLFRPQSGLPMPSLKPDWGIENPTKPRIFKNSLQALHSVKKILS